MDIRIICIVSFSILYASFEFLMSRLNAKNSSISKSGDRGSLWWLTFSIGMGYWLSFIIASTKIGRIYHWNTFILIGSILTITGLIIRISSILTLKKQFTYTVTKIEDHHLIESGLYKYIRHPGYLGQLIIFLGISASLSNWLSIIGMLLPVMCGYIYRIVVEEKFMIEQMGQEYLKYQKGTKKLIPFIY